MTTIIGVLLGPADIVITRPILHTRLTRVLGCKLGFDVDDRSPLQDTVCFWEILSPELRKRKNNRTNKDLCVEKLSLVLPDRPPYVPREFDRCAVAGNSGDHLKMRFGKEIDSYENYTEYVGKKSTIRLLNRESARSLDKVVELDATRKKVLIIKTMIHDFYESNDSG
ncbi:sialyltransferase-like protein 4 [Gossypium raimondii]|uniref:sialyltransferase-like protein 4 n=1 Tax=Gossypium raimondii TaxID=29730 RepID=UPI00227AFF13|nr:sialyltransferase-like protein 4 [Gossypium raimondii]